MGVQIQPLSPQLLPLSDCLMIDHTEVREMSNDDLTLLEEMPYRVTWQCRQQKGYKYAGYPIRQKVALHDYCEDFYFPTDDTPLSDYISKHSDQIFIMADGHAGHEAARYFTSGIATGLIQILNERMYDFSDSKHQQVISELICNLFEKLDREYTNMKIKEYQEWLAGGQIRQKKPMDDGCTMVVNIIQRGWILNCNVGDSRTVVAKPSLEHQEWVQCFSSMDHNMMHPEKVHDIHRNGGKFLDMSGTTFLNINVEPPEIRNGKLYAELCYSRLFRPICDEIRQVGCSHRRTLNLTGTMGDLLFKISPPVLTSKPDLTFIKLDPTEHILVVATDGLWDHLHANGVDVQNRTVLRKITDYMEQNITIGSDSDMNDGVFDALGQLCEVLVDREGDSMDELFTMNVQRYDDATVMIIHIDP
ncbi:hypothetical protein HK103_006685 [Boothiomyces macroporosus]|uniref:PPM-type phosphatase domain-containing protein n=1 Tax=Boothiomyces macroporosus TaxID=261099 RepID=A0AAD5UH27_9FUNG|nr:hypothetical protein HK103_006685 [Boothiomyces macroporosus]